MKAQGENPVLVILPKAVRKAAAPKAGDRAMKIKSVEAVVTVEAMGQIRAYLDGLAAASADRGVETARREIAVPNGEWLLAWLMSKAQREELLGDLEELFRQDKVPTLGLWWRRFGIGPRSAAVCGRCCGAASAG